MVQIPRRTTIRGPTFIRLLAALNDADVAQPRLSLSDRLSQWIDWNQALALSTALDEAPSAADPEASSPGVVDEDECARVRAALSAAISDDPAFSRVATGGGATVVDDTLDYAFFRQRYLAVQQSMQTGIGNLRRRLREMLATGTVEMGRLAAVDAVMERALSRRERGLLATAPALLEGHFERLRQAARELPAVAPESEDAPPATADAWLDVFRKDMQNLLLAELDVRFQPVEGLLAAVRTR